MDRSKTHGARKSSALKRTVLENGQARTAHAQKRPDQNASLRKNDRIIFAQSAE